MNKILKIVLILVVFTFVFVAKSDAATLSSVSDTITTSRPSASAPLSADAAVGTGNLSITANGSTFLASDSATLWGGPGARETINVATTSADKATIFLSNNLAGRHIQGTAVTSVVTAMHKVQFTTISSIPVGGTIELTFPTSVAADTEQASPSANTFMFNGLTTSNMQVNFSSGTSTCTLAISGTSAGSAPKIVCTVATAAVNGAVTVTFLIGCSANSGASCTTQVPTLINPTKNAATAPGTADTWGLSIATFNTSGGTQLDSAKTKVGTQESVMVVAHVEPTFTFVIAGVADATSINTSSYCGTSHAADTSNTGFPTTPTDVNLGTLTNLAINRAHQTMTITSNSAFGYSITATSSGHLLNPANGYFVRDAQGDPTDNGTPAPTTVAAGTAAFGIHACDTAGNVATGTWAQSPAKFANPSASYYYTLSSSSSMPAASGDQITVEYAATVDGRTPPGDYRTVMTYVASPIF